jgi:hypothetical protein
VDKLRRAKKVVFVAIAALAIVFGVNAPSQARGGGGHGFEGGHPDAAFGHHDFDGHRDFDRFGHDRFQFGFGGGYEDPAYWYYCPTYGAYYPNVASCPETWIPVPAS